MNRDRFFRGSSLALTVVGLIAGCDRPASVLPLSPQQIAASIAGRGAPEFADTTAQRFVSAFAQAEPLWQQRNLRLTRTRALYAASDNTPSYYLFNVTCDEATPCGYVTVNIDGSSSPVPEYNTSGAEPLALQDLKADAKVYRLSAFDWFAVADAGVGPAVLWQSGDDPPIAYDVFQAELNDFRSKKAARRNEPLNADLNQSWSEVLADHGFESPIEIHMLPAHRFPSMPLRPQNSVGGTTVSTGCSSPIPCYKQLTNTSGCIMGCTPVAFGMIYGYWDYNGGLTSMIPGSADYQSRDVNDMVWQINNYIGTTCNGSTSAGWFADLSGANNYAIGRGYRSSRVETVWHGVDYFLFGDVSAQIDANRPALLSYWMSSVTQGHSVAAYGYTISGSTKTIRANTGWSSPTTKVYTVDDRDFDLLNMARVLPN